MGRHQVPMVLFLVIGLSAISGCLNNNGAATRAELKGRVTFDGTPVADGVLNMIPANSQGNKVSVPITSGDYLIPKDNGPDFGNYRVEIYAFEPISAPPGSVEGDAEAASATRQIIPPKFNKQSILELDVNAIEMNQDFDLASR